MVSKQSIILSVIKDHEGGYVDNPNDLGGPTKYGITQRTARASGYQADMADLTIDQAVSIYSVEYWDKMRLDDILEIFPRGNLAALLFDCHINLPILHTARFLQRSLNTLQDVKLATDGRIGSQTIAALRNYSFPSRGRSKEMLENGLIVPINAMRAMHYVEITEKREKNRAFTFGWFMRCMLNTMTSDK